MFQTTEEGTGLSVSLQRGDLVTLIVSLLLKTPGAYRVFRTVREEALPKLPLT